MWSLIRVSSLQSISDPALIIGKNLGSDELWVTSTYYKPSASNQAPPASETIQYSATLAVSGSVYQDSFTFESAGSTVNPVSVQYFTLVYIRGKLMIMFPTGPAKISCCI